MQERQRRKVKMRDLVVSQEVKVANKWDEELWAV
jgi:hypothetical protein